MNDKYIEFLEERIRLASSKKSLSAYIICLEQYKKQKLIKQNSLKDQNLWN